MWWPRECQGVGTRELAGFAPERPLAPPIRAILRDCQGEISKLSQMFSYMYFLARGNFAKLCVNLAQGEFRNEFREIPTGEAYPSTLASCSAVGPRPSGDGAKLTVPALKPREPCVLMPSVREQRKYFTYAYSTC